MELGEASSASVRLLELAQRTADEAVANARIESDNLRNSTESEVLKMMTETKANIAIMSRDFDAQKAAMERRVEELRAYEREYRSRLRSYLEGQLRELETKNLGGDRQVEG
jgi:cell division septum initiation protein DivIVA